MKSLETLCEGLLDKGLDTNMDDSVLGAFGDFCKAIRSAKFEQDSANKPRVSDDTKLLEAARKAAISKEYEIASPAPIYRMMKNKRPGTVMTVHNAPGEGHWRMSLINTETNKMISLTWSNYIPKGEVGKMWIYAERDVTPSGNLQKTLGFEYSTTLYKFPAWVYEHFIKCIK